VRLTVICTTVDTPYSGMLPGYISGHYSFDDCTSTCRLAAFAGARFYQDEVVGLDTRQPQGAVPHPPARAVRPVCSINVGSTPQVARVPGAEAHAVPVKPILNFNQRWLALLERVRAHPGTTTIALVGGGAGGVELTLSMQYRLRAS
jgi:selenide,water dikinase